MTKKPETSWFQNAVWLKKKKVDDNVRVTTVRPNAALNFRIDRAFLKETLDVGPGEKVAMAKCHDGRGILIMKPDADHAERYQLDKKIGPRYCYLRFATKEVFGFGMKSERYREEWICEYAVKGKVLCIRLPHQIQKDRGDQGITLVKTA